MQQPARILCNWQPSALNSETIKREWDALMAERGVIAEREPQTPDGLWYPRSPEENHRLANDRVFMPFVEHQDGHNGLTPPLLLSWSNEVPVDIFDADMRPWGPAKPGDVVLIFNQIGYHRLPPVLKDWELCKNRWSMRMWCEVVPL